MKKQFSWLAILIALTVSIGVLSCSSDDDNDSSLVSGLYYWENPSGSRTAYNFVNSNTVDIYGAMDRDRNAKWLGNSGTAFPLRSGWYYWTGNKSTHSYMVAGNKVIIGTDRIMTISGNTLIYDDLGVILYKWD
jgi:hypothetical protein